MFLAISSHRALWDGSDEVLLLGPWCLGPGQEPGPRETLLPCPWDDRARLDAGIAACERMHLRLIELLADFLNAELGVSHGRRYWHVLLGPWALFHTHLAYMCHARLSDAFETRPDLGCRLLAEKDFYTPWDTADFIRFYYADTYALQMASQLLRGMGKSFSAVSLPAAPAEVRPPRSSLKRRVKGGAARAAAWISERVPCAVVSDSLYPMGRQLLRLMSAHPGRLRPFLSELPAALRRDSVLDERRRRLGSLPLGEGFGRLLALSLPRALPSVFLEGFAAFREYGLRRLGPTPRLVVAGSQLHFNDLFKLAVAEFRERGARVVGFQHGGGYGNTKAPVAEAHERAVTDAYLTWGWSATEPERPLRDVPLPHVSELARRRPPRWRKAEDILVATSAGLKNPHHLFHSPCEQQWLEFFRWRDRFFGALPERLHARTSLRFHPLESVWGDRDRVRKAFPWLRLDDFSTPFLERLTRARLVVTDHPTTAFLETLALGVPSVHFWQEERWELRDAVRPAFEPLKRAGIVHADPESAARQAAKVYDDPAPWWGSPEVVAARRDFVRLFARTEPDWVGAWWRVLDGELEAAGPCPR